MLLLDRFGSRGITPSSSRVHWSRIWPCCCIGRARPTWHLVASRTTCAKWNTTSSISITTHRRTSRTGGIGGGIGLWGIASSRDYSTHRGIGSRRISWILSRVARVGVRGAMGYGRIAWIGSRWVTWIGRWWVTRVGRWWVTRIGCWWVSRVGCRRIARIGLRGVGTRLWGIRSTSTKRR